MFAFRRGLRLVGRALFVVIIALVAGLAPVAVIPFLYVAPSWRRKEVAAWVVRAR